ncbi:HXXEE domain-containing protein [Lactobacillus sp. CC-MHH1034]|uniref:HXXEE domain-containing protein n=1 Tax=Agrilactobacillus fermenti TaxID=2586909 RepID=UPI0038B29A9B|nr:HXXEE domain-containing protein [Agrilactobacillus fermenti]
MNNAILYLSFPILFMLHELEELAYMPSWYQKKLVHFQKIPQKLKQYLKTPPRAFALIVLEEYLLILIVGAICYFNNSSVFFIALIIAYNLHIIGHVLQALYLKTYVPGLCFGILSFVGLTYLLVQFTPPASGDLLIIFVPLYLILLMLNLFIMHKWLK